MARQGTCFIFSDAVEAILLVASVSIRRLLNLFLAVIQGGCFPSEDGRLKDFGKDQHPRSIPRFPEILEIYCNGGGSTKRSTNPQVL